MTDTRTHPSEDGSQAPDERLVYGTVRSQLEAVDLSRHVASFFRSPAEQLPMAAAFLSHGLDRNEYCVYVADQHDTEAVRAYLREVGIEVDAHEAAGQLVVARADEMYLDDGTFDPERVVEHLLSAARRCREDGYDGLRAAGENSWSFDIEQSFEAVLDFEADFDAQCRDLPVSALCQYDLDRFDDADIAEVLQTHEQVFYRGTLCENPFYVPPETYLEHGTERSTAELMLEQARELTERQRDLADREQRLSVVTRVLRHNLRNDVGVLLGHLEHLYEHGYVAPEGEDSLTTAFEVASDLVALAQKARYIEQTLGPVTRQPLELVAVVEETAETLTERTAGTVHVEGVTEATVVASPSIQIAVEELLATVLAAAESVTVTVRRDAPAERTHLDVSCGGTPVVPQAERSAVVGDTETPLQHCSGLSMWVVRWLVEASDGTLALVGEDDPATCLRVSLPTATPR